MRGWTLSGERGAERHESRLRRAADLRGLVPIGALLFLCFSFPCGASAARDEAVEDQPSEALIDVVDLTVPDSPAFDILGVAPQSVTRPADPRALALALLQGVDPRGNMQSGLALEFVPYLLVKGDRLTLGDYRASAARRAWSRLQLSLASAKGTSELDRGLRLALGVRWTVFDRGDPRLDGDLIACIDRAHQAPSAPLSPLANEGEQLIWESATEARVEKMAAACRSTARASNWNKAALDIGIAPVWVSPTGLTDDMDFKGLGGWISFAHPMSRKGQWIVQGRYRHGEVTGTSRLFFGARVIEQDTFVVSGRARYGSSRRALLADAAYVRAEPRNAPAEHSYRYSIGGELKVAPELWLQAVAGVALNEIGRHGSSFVSGQFKWAFSRERAYQVP